MTILDRRGFLAGSSLAALASMTGRSTLFAQQAVSPSQPHIMAFTKFLQDLSFDELASTVKELGFDGVEATVRKGGHVEPEQVEEQLPKLAEALEKHGVQFTAMTTDVLEDNALSRRVLKTGKDLGVRSYRMGFYKYDPDRSVLPQVDEIRGKMTALADLNRDLGMQAVYQNHSGAKYFGATLWDLHAAIKDLPVEFMSSAFDIRHTTIEAGLAWPKLYDIMKPHIGAIFVKDFVWNDKKAEHVPLGTGRVDPLFFEILKKDEYAGPFSLHVEYLKKEGVAANIDALRRDLKQLREWIA